MFGLGFQEVLLLLLVGLLIFGPRRLPELGKSLGQAIREFKKSMQGPDEKTDQQVPPKDNDKPAAP